MFYFVFAKKPGASVLNPTGATVTEQAYGTGHVVTFEFTDSADVQAFDQAIPGSSSGWICVLANGNADEASDPGIIEAAQSHL